MDTNSWASFWFWVAGICLACVFLVAGVTLFVSGFHFADPMNILVRIGLAVTAILFALGLLATHGD